MVGNAILTKSTIHYEQIMRHIGIKTRKKVCLGYFVYFLFFTLHYLIECNNNQILMSIKKNEFWRVQCAEKSSIQLVPLL